MSTSLGGTTFPTDIMVEIMSRVPAKPLTRFKLVNKSWENLISSRSFVIKNYLTTGFEINRLGFIFQSGTGCYPIEYRRTIDVEILNQRFIMEGDPRMTVLCSAHELITFCNREDEFFLSNPRSGEFLMLPVLPVPYPDNIFRASAFFGMGYLAETDEYIVLRVILFEQEETEFPEFLSCVHIYSSRTRIWKCFGDFPYDYPVADPGVWAGGCINWVVKSKGYNDYIASFDCLLETFNIVPVPSGSVCESGLADIGSLNSKTLVIYSCICNSFNNFEFWILWDYNNHSSWTRMLFDDGYNIPNNEFILGIQPLCLLQTACNCIVFRLEPFGTFVEYDMEQRTYRSLRGNEVEEDCCDVFPFVQSLLRFHQLV